MRYINTVNGKISTENMGVTLMHEHVFNLYPFYKEKENMEFVNKQIEKVKFYNVNTIVDLTPYAKFGTYKNFINECDINIICPIGFYLDKYIPKTYKNASVSELVEKLSKRIECGIGKYKYKPGIIKLAANNPNLNNQQIKFFEVAAILQKKYHIPVATHSPKGGLQHLIYLTQLGALSEHIYLSHIENEINSQNYETKLQDIEMIMDMGGNIVVTNFGTNKNGSRCKNTVKLMDYLKSKNHLSQTLISTDSNWRWKGNNLKLRDSHLHGAEKTYSYVFEYIIPALKTVNYDEKDIKRMMIENPKGIFDF